ncbi:MAG: serine hydrolase [Phycisphaerae bacterium]|nr:serine hydrolase [Phycisphaerae bacterium]NIU11386.1 serine hydrolase [Phycisphaerae bacterium]NIU59163.1 serine hydrolase [Phycisphaerae bacterium]NIW95511.1 serine hydrolase [Phycisphaerae bacterium]NIX26037.1 serine hydrolase [Phycisphaerae bacterium]
MQKFKHLFVVAVLFSRISLIQSAPFQNLSGLANKIDEILTAYHKYGMFQGAVLVAMKGQVIYRKAFGFANIEWQIPNTPDTKFTIASLGKAFTAAIVLQLVEEGHLKLEDPVSKHLSSYRKDIGNKVAIHQLLSHSAGIPWGPDNWPDEKFAKHYTLDDLVDIANQEELAFEPGSQFLYCNSCYNLLGAMIEEVTGHTFKEELQRRILDPAGMKNTGLVEHNPILEKRAAGYNRLATGEFVNAPLQDQSYAKGAGGMYSTVDDLYLWDQALYDDTILSSKSRELMFTSYIKNSGYGWGVGAYVKNGVEGRGKFAYGFGGTRGFASVIARFLDDRYFIVALGNMRPIPQGEIGNKIWNTILGFDEEPPLPPVSESLYRKLFDKGIKEAVAEYGELKEIKNVPNVPSESDINSAAFYYLESHRIEEAITICQFNLDLHPNSANAYASLGEAYTKLGDKQHAIESYKKALEIDSKMSTVTRALKKLVNEN